MFLVFPLAAQGATIDDINRDVSAWSPHPSDGVDLRISQDPGRSGKAMRLDFDFHGHAGYAIARRTVDIDLPPNYEFTWWMRADAPVNNLEFKLIDASGDNVWWTNRRDYEFPRDWREVITRKRQIGFAWGPAGGGEIRHVAAVEIVVTASSGGKGTVWIDDFTLHEMPADAGRAELGGASGGEGEAYERPFDAVREIGGLTIDWSDRFMRDFAVDVSRDGKTFDRVRTVKKTGGGKQLLWLPEVDARVIRIVPLRTSGGDGWRINSLAIEKPGWAETASDFFAHVAKQADRGDYPRYLFGEQPYWTIAGADPAQEEVLVGEDGNIEPFKRGFSIEPFLRIGDRVVRWSDVSISHSLDRGDLPVVTSTWHRVSEKERLQLATTSFVSPADTLYVRYRLTSHAASNATLFLAVRPFQVNPTTQFLNTPGGASPIREIGVEGSSLIINGEARIVPARPPHRIGASTFDEGNIVDAFRRGEPGFNVWSVRNPAQTGVSVPHTKSNVAQTLLSVPPQHVTDDFGYASAALEYPVALQAGVPVDIVIAVPLNAKSRITDWSAALEATRRSWKEKLDRVKVEIPAAPEIANALRSNIAYILINRDGAGLQPGSRSYERSWIRDGALIASCLLRLGNIEAAREFAEWYAPYQFDDGKVPCCVDRRGADPVPENDSHGQFIYLVAEIWRFTRDEAFVRRMWPHVDAAARYIAKLRSENHGEFEGLLTESISHEGYSAKPMHSYWDDFFGVRGVEDAAMLAGVMKMPERQHELEQQASSFRSDLAASIRRTIESHKIDFVPGSAELGDFDATSTAIAISPLELMSIPPAAALDRTFARYLDEFRARRDGKLKWDVYTPYEMRTIGALVRRGNRAAANEMLDYFMNDRRPHEWNAWPEVVTRDYREPRFLGDIPHSWVGSDFMRSVLDFFAYDREDEALVVGAGIPEKWVRGSHVEAGPLRTYTGTIDVKMRGTSKRVVIELGGTAKPARGIVVTSPYEAKVKSVSVHGKRVAAADSVKVTDLPARIVFEY